MSRSICFVIPGDSNELGPNKRLHWQAERRIKEQWRSKVSVCFLLCYGDSGLFFQRARITFTLRRGRLLDPDNAHSSRCLKVLVDVLKAWLFPDDKQACVEYGPIRQETGKQWRLQPEVEVLVEELK